jgi:hypothetical protein
VEEAEKAFENDRQKSAACSTILTLPGLPESKRLRLRHLGLQSRMAGIVARRACQGDAARNM